MSRSLRDSSDEVLLEASKTTRSFVVQLVSLTTPWVEMAFLGKAKKQDLVLLAEELGQKVSDKMTNIELRNIIIGSKDYEEEFVRDQLSVILEERLERESKEKIQQQREFELEKMRLEIERSRFDPENLSPLKTSVSDLIKIIPNFDIRDGDIVLFLTLFERQAKRIGVEKTNWVSALFGTHAARYYSANSQRVRR
ncbi:CCHC-type domain-containing protein [Trichonephila clavipes]|nr:CCHC-type domain-containing protein [Trichonephila clavipes]